MSRRVLWSSIALVVLILLGSSLIASGGEATERMTHLLPWARSHRNILLGVSGGLLIVAIALRVGGGRRSRPHTVPSEEAEGVEFGDLLSGALEREGRGGRDGRRHEVLALHRSGRSIGEIARSTRLSQDAVRAVIDAG